MTPPQVPPRARAEVGRADLLLARAAGIDLDLAAELLGFERVPVLIEVETAREVATLEKTEPDDARKPGSLERIKKKRRTSPGAPTPPPPFWMPTYFEILPPLEERVTPPKRPELADGEERERVTARFDPLASRPEILAKLRRRATSIQATRSVDVDRLVGRVARGEPIRRVPFVARRRWGTKIRVVVDRGEHLKAYWADQDLVLAALRELYPREGFEVAWFEESYWEPTLHRSDGKVRAYVDPEAGTPVLVLSDLGLLQYGGGPPRAFRSHALRWWNRGCPTYVLMPSRSRPEARAGEPWEFIPWEGSADPRPMREGERHDDEAVRRLLGLLAFAARLEPQLLRAARRALYGSGGDPGLEALAWNHEAIATRDFRAATFDPAHRASLREHGPKPSDAVKRRLLTRLREIRAAVYEGILHAEVLDLGEDDARSIGEEAYDHAYAWLHARRREIERAGGKVSDAAAYWYRRVLGPVRESGALSEQAKALVASLLETVDPEAKAGPSLFELRQGDLELSARPFDPATARSAAPEDRSTPVALFRAGSRRVEFREIPFWPGGRPPSWADDWGWDDFGRWVTLRVDDAVQKLRWIEPGSFLLGSPEDEEGRWEDEGPQRRVEIERGFWIFDTPCTQALWGAVMGENPSKFKGPDRPVERITWDDCGRFLERIRERFPDIGLALPSEEQWEYSCRAGTTGPRYADDLDAIAWYAENSGRETHPVGLKAPNAWGLFDTLGNVWEWCSDAWTDDHGDKARAAPPSARRVIRGGSWGLVARSVRAAYRHWSGPSDRLDYLGFRCAEFQAVSNVSSGRAGRPGERSLGAEDGRGARRSGAEPPPTAPERPGAASPRILLADGGGLAFDSIAPIRLETDRERLILEPARRPPWAADFGRDQYGPWADLVIEPTTKSSPLAKQRLRWIPPGTATLGSPVDDPERFGGEHHPHDVVFSRGFWMFDTPCTQALWEAVMGENPSRFKGPGRPVERISWDDCGRFLERLLEGVPDLRLALPSEVQWEYACRAGTTGPRYADDLDAIAWHWENSGRETHPVGLKAPNAWGLYDTLGNVFEWCSDVRARDHGDKARAASAPARRVIRGGSWGFVARFVRAAYRRWFEPSLRSRVLGFRCAEFRQFRT
ncbi:MAG: formylglycine-generating enzyme family protein [Isosphaeraceae bacterium]|nr:formylglycine-generating enzyme family protein [Isosphaeraceae bacterium]